MFKSGFVSVVGEPNVGKSTLVNALLGKKVSIVSHKPQTTRNRILGILHKKEAQIVLMDSPGFFRATKAIDHHMVKAAKKTLREGEIVLFIADSTKRRERIIESFSFLHGNKDSKAILLLNKIDLMPKEEVLPLIKLFSESGLFKDIIPISALKKENLDTVVKTVISYCNEGPRFFPENMNTDQPENFLMAEIIREKVFRFTHKEIPYSSFVTVEKVTESTKSILEVSGTIFVEKESQKAIVIGTKGKVMKIIGEQARKEIESILGVRLYLNLWVKVKKNWRNDERRLDELIY